MRLNAAKCTLSRQAYTRIRTPSLTLAGGLKRQTLTTWRYRLSAT